MVRSMTGFGRGNYNESGKEFTVEIKSVNHRYIDFYIKLPRQIAYLEERVREVVSKSIFRGKVDIFISFEDRSEDSKNVMLDEALAGAYIQAVESLKDKYGLKDDISVSLVSRFPDVLRIEKTEDDEEQLWGILNKALEAAVDSLVQMREKEGNELRMSLLQKADYMENIISQITNRSPEVVIEYKQKLENRIKELLNQQTVDENRLAMEVAIFADRCGIDEELVRLGSHLLQLRDILSIKKQPVGRKLDFLVQEINREINTIGSKSNDIVITKNVLELKSETEKIREQIQNIE
ncbi:YicC/YloC family endoribonuclease [Ruminiclostridium cellobioparum]|uniref:TIGR00255 family protein n=1 Tax=Ruminiclostridium cellobioparum subsp. termitidis CT1112 TaxID=1195236 RepID=S0FW31_RUMCE|nr:YicC/YloC family endoribonuclease [Ruminiclostridium cellobioparum]EMS73364.1 TIGR00255 family protein [Ruminiclostridium cellobioparum subsp. termitidis CT1112]